MKNINTKKVVAGVAALGLSALLAGSVVASNVGGDDFSLNITKDSMFSNGVPNVSVVVGSMAQPVDVVWAGNIAAAIGKKAYVSTAVAGGDATFDDVTVEVGAEGKTVITGDGYLKDNMGMAQEIPITNIRNRDYSVLYDDELEYRDYDRKTQTISRVRETINVTIDNVYFEQDIDVQEILAKINTGAIEYKVDLGDSIVFGEDDGGWKDLLKVGGRHSIEIPFLGGKYNIRSVTSTNATTISEIQLVSKDQTTIHSQGERFAVEGYEIEVGTITSGPPNKVLVRLFDGATLLRSESLESGDDTDFNGLLDEDITIVDVQYASDQMGFIEVSMADGIMTLNTTDEIFVDSDGREWEITEIEAGGGKLKSITVKNLDGWIDDLQTDEFPALRIGDSVELPGYLGTVDFLGLEEEDRFYFKTSRSSSYTPISTLILEWENEDADHKIPVYAERPINTGGSRTMKVTIDSKDYWITYTDSGEFPVNIREVDDTTVDDVVEEVTVLMYSHQVPIDGDNDSVRVGYCPVDKDDLKLDSFIKIQSDIEDNVYHYYYLGGKNPSHFGTTNFGLALSNAFKPTTAAIDCENATSGLITYQHMLNLTSGTDDPAPYNGAGSSIADEKYELGDTSSNNAWSFMGSIIHNAAWTDFNFGSDYVFYYKGDAAKDTDAKAALAQFNIFDVDYTSSTNHLISILFDTESNRLADVEEYTSNMTGKTLIGDLSHTVNVNKKLRYTNANAKAYNLVLNDDDSEDLREGITTSGAHLDISGKQLTLNFPEDAQDVLFFVGGGATTDIGMIGSQVTLTTIGDILEANGINVKLVDYTVSGGIAEGDAMVPANWNVNTRRLVYLDNETITGAGPKVIVGGHLVNILADGITNEYLTQSGQYVVGQTGTGDVIVAGWTATDTANAAKELISVIENM